jgi:Rad3-related DNA helicase
VQALKQIEAAWDKADVFVVDSPVAVGKSKIALAVAAWANGEKKLKSNILTPQNMLVEQYKKENPRLFSLQKRSFQRCHAYPASMKHEEASCETHHKEYGEYCPDCPYVRRVRQASSMPYGVMNYYTYMAHKLFKPVLLMDEAHAVLPMLRDLAAVKLWWHDYHYPSWVETYGGLKKWLEGNPDRDKDKKLKKLWALLGEGRQRKDCPPFLLEKTTDLYRGDELPLIKLLPLDVSQEKPVLWPEKKVQKIVLLSATISQIDLDTTGLASRRVCYIKTGSAIPIEQRPVVFRPVVDMGRASIEESIPALAKFLREYRATRKGKGIVHVTYSVSEMLQEHLGGKDSGFLFHDSLDKLSTLASWRGSPTWARQCLIAAGMDEGLDLAGEDYTWQVISKVRYPSLEDVAWRYLAEAHPDRYCWEAFRSMLQASGRICRTPTDYGITLIVDSQFERLYSQAEKFGLVPEWFREALLIDKGEFSDEEISCD